MSEFDLDYTKDNRRNAKKEAAMDHFKNGKKMVRRHKDSVQEKEKTSTELAEISHLGFKVRQSLKHETLEILKNFFVFGDKYINETKYFPQNTEIKFSSCQPVHEDGPNLEFPVENIISFISSSLEDTDTDTNKWCILNYANPVKPGGGFEKEASVYEEALSLSSGLYFSLSKGEGACMFTKNYEYEQKNEDGVFRSDLIYSPNVPLFRDEEFNVIEDIDENYLEINIISIPALNYNKFSKHENFTKEKYQKIMKDRIHRIYSTALKYGHTKLILGPWGCGLEGGPLEDIIQWFSDDDLSDYFDEIYFLCDDEETSQIMKDIF